MQHTNLKEDFEPRTIKQKIEDVAAFVVPAILLALGGLFLAEGTGATDIISDEIQEKIANVLILITD